jgi:regulator of sirC expression with transglutaminase-like and TPR domain
VDSTFEFIEAVSGPEQSADLERLALLISAHARPSIDIDQVVQQIDHLASFVDGGDLDSLRDALFDRCGFQGDSNSYYAEENSYLDAVIQRRRGIPITLSVLTIAIGARIGVPLLGIGFPGHFLVRSSTDANLFLDPFSGGVILDPEGCRSLYRRTHGTEKGFLPDHLRPVGTYSIIERMLNNLLAIFRSRSESRSQLWVAQLRASLPQATVVHRADLASALARGGRFDDAADLFDRLAQESHPDAALSLRAARDRMRSLMN